MTSVDTIPDWGVDLADSMRPGVPMETPPGVAGEAHWDEPERQEGVPSGHAEGSGIPVTPVFGTAQPPKGLSGVLRSAAYRIPDHKVKHWLMLLLADRVDVAEHRLARIGPLAIIALPLLAGGAWLALRARRTR